jgi:hypothetical protein
MNYVTIDSLLDDIQALERVLVHLPTSFERNILKLYSEFYGDVPLDGNNTVDDVKARVSDFMLYCTLPPVDREPSEAPYTLYLLHEDPSTETVQGEWLGEFTDSESLFAWLESFDSTKTVLVLSTEDREVTPLGRAVH